jgi:hypothetical protein
MVSVYVELYNVSGRVDSSLPRLQAEAVFVLEGAADLMRALMMILSLIELGLEMSEKEQ